LVSSMVRVPWVLRDVGEDLCSAVRHGFRCSLFLSWAMVRLHLALLSGVGGGRDPETAQHFWLWLLHILARRRTHLRRLNVE
jgi:hypothetical protein